MPPENVCDHAAAPLGQADQLQHVVDAAVELAPGHAVELAVEAQVLLGGEVDVERRVLEDQADAAADVVPLGAHVVAGDPGAAGGRPGQRAQDLDRGGLARAVGAEEAEGLARLDPEVDAADGLDVAVPLLQAGDLDGGRALINHGDIPPLVVPWVNLLC